jgi:hypothetical protein
MQWLGLWYSTGTVVNLTVALLLFDGASDGEVRLDIRARAQGLATLPTLRAAAQVAVHQCRRCEGSRAWL